MRNKALIILIAVSYILSACTSSVPEPPVPEKPKFVSIEEPTVDLPPHSVSIDSVSYAANNGIACLQLSESYHNVRDYFQLSLGEFFEKFLEGLGYSVRVNQTSGNCDLRIDINFDIELLSAQYPVTCHTGISLDSQVLVSIPSENVQAEYNFGRAQNPPDFIDIDECYNVEENPLVIQWTYDDEFKEHDSFLEVLNQIWGDHANIAILSVNGSMEGLEDLQREAWSRVWSGNKSNIDVAYVAHAFLSNEESRERLIRLLEASHPDSLDETIISVLLWDLNNGVNQENTTIELVVKEVQLLDHIQPGQEYIDQIASVLFDLAEPYYGIQEGPKASDDPDEDFIEPAIAVMAGIGPEVIPYANWYLFNHNTVNPEAVTLAVKVLTKLAKDGHEDQVAKKSGNYLTYILSLQEEGDFEYPGEYSHKHVLWLLRELFPKAVKDSYPKSSDFYRQWKKVYGN